MSEIMVWLCASLGSTWVWKKGFARGVKFCHLCSYWGDFWVLEGVMKQILSEIPVRFRPQVLQWGLFCWAFPAPLIFCIFLVSWTKTQTASFPPAPPTISEGVPCFFFSCDTAKPTATSKKSAELPKLAAVERKGGMPRLLWYSRKAGKFSPSG